SKKRKRQSNGVDTPSKKTTAINGVHQIDKIKVTFTDEDGLHPVLLSTPGLTTPSFPFESYARAWSSKDASRTPAPKTHELLLHSSQHPRIDYTASASALDEHLAHYVAVFDPTTSALQITPAHHVTLRAAPRKAGIADGDKDEGKATTRGTYAAQRETLGREFGTKKAQKVIASRTQNAISKDAKGKGKMSEAQDAVLESMATSTPATAPSKQQEDLLASKPIPQPNLAAETVEEVYPFSTLIPPHTSRLITITDWQTKARANEEILLNHRFPAFRVGALGKSDDIPKLKALRYLALLLDFHDALAAAGRAGKKVPKKEILQRRLAAWSSPEQQQLVDSVRRRFANEANELPKWHMDNLCTHICALSLYVDGWMTNTTDLKLDLKLTNQELGRYYAELGAKMSAPTEREKVEWKIKTKAEAADTKVARLRLPLEFPK
ncbi:hypothetical protein BAUCODRAFT_45380, partial [Baudoinia panamericana UAMH 10762]